jgi:hypothetical protein
MISASLDAGNLPYLSIRDHAGKTALIYEGNKDPVIMEFEGGMEKRLEGKDVLPWDLRQSRLHYSNDKD